MNIDWKAMREAEQEHNRKGKENFSEFLKKQTQESNEQRAEIQRLWKKAIAEKK